MEADDQEVCAKLLVSSPYLSQLTPATQLRDRRRGVRAPRDRLHNQHGLQGRGRHARRRRQHAEHHRGLRRVPYWQGPLVYSPHELTYRPSCATRCASRPSCPRTRAGPRARSRTSILSELGGQIQLTGRGTFRPDRVRAVADRFGVDGQQALENILCARAWSSEQQCELLVELAIQ